MFKIEIISDHSSFSELEGSWQTLSDRDPRANLFNSFEWLKNWIEVFWTAEYQLHIALIQTAGKTVGILPLYINTKTKKLLFIGIGEPETAEVCSEYLDFILDEETAKSETIYSFIADYISSIPVASIDFINCVDGSYSYKTSLLMERCSLSVTGAKYFLSLKEEYTSIIKGFSKNHIKKCKSLINRFNKIEELSFSGLIEGDYKENWSTIKELHNQDWHSRGESGAFSTKEFNSFHNLMNENFSQIKQYFSLLSFDNSVIAINHYYQYKDILYFYQSGAVKNEHNRLSPGVMLHALSIQDMSEKELVYDFMKGDIEGSYKEKFCKSHGEFYTISIYNKNLLGTFRFLKFKSKKLLKQFFKKEKSSHIESNNKPKSKDKSLDSSTGMILNKVT